ncbi:hypothetical protein H2199_003042 [Coniosporium tulheliwenetii]|uniref:Uncharacterized protein n=1 Tax=Coniosporium tulheliwenetii TaxID=3383036 RepID=A0ACC2ZFB2_9PEZI|nr:hypothetical protein H2199_003042 [Cladosporium sp. JES 115]
MSKSPFVEGKGLESGDALVTHIRDLENEFAMDTTGRRAVAEKYQGTEEDQYTMKVLGRTQELRRNFGFLPTLGFASTLIATWEIILATLLSGLTNGGTAGLFWGYLVVATGFFLVYLSVAEMASMAPTSGGQYHWVSEFAPRSCQRYLSYLTGWLTFIGWQSGVAGTSFMVGTTIQGLIVLNYDSYSFQSWHGTLLVIGVTSFGIAFNTIFARRLPLVENILMVLHVLGWFPIALPLWILGPRADAKAVFTEYRNNGGWSTNGTSFLVGLNPLVISLLGFDCVAHMSEEIRDASRTVPVSIIWGKLLNAVFGLGMIITVIFVWGDMDEIALSPTGYPFIQIFYNITHSYAGTNIMTAIIIVTLTACVIATVATASRQVWSFARDNGPPFSAILSRVKPGWDIPLNAVLISLAVTILLSLINLGSSVALTAMFSLSLASGMTSYTLCIGCVLLKRFRGESFRIGGGRWAASLFPAVTPVKPSTMNWAVVMYGSVVLFATGYYFVVGKKVYISPAERVRRDASF